MGSLFTSLGLREGEGARTSRLFGFIFLLTAAAVLARSAQREIFLAAYPRSAIPDAFLFAAGVLAFASLGVSALVSRVGLMRLVQVLLVTAAAVLALSRLALSWLPSVAPMVVYVVVEVLVSLLLAQGWAVASEVVDVRAAKRLLPLVGFGAGLAWTVGGLGVGAAARAVGPGALLVLAPVALLGALALFQVVWVRDVQEAVPRSVAVARGLVDGLRSMLTEPLMRTLAVIITLELVVEKVTDFQLLATAQERFAGQTGGIAAFMGLFYGVTGAVTLAAPLVTGRALSRFGSTRAMMVGQVWVVVGSLLFVLMPAFAVVVALTGVDRILKQALGGPARTQVMGALSSVRRAQAGALLRGVLAGAFAALAAVALKALPPSLPVQWLSVGSVVLMSVLVFLTWRDLRRSYVEALQRSVDHTRLDLDDGPTTQALDREHLATLREELASPDASRAALALTVLATAPLAQRQPLVYRALRHPAPEVRAQAVMALASSRTPEDRVAVLETLQDSPEDTVRCACLEALAQMGAVEAVGALEPLCEAASPKVRALARACRARLLELGGGAGRGAGQEVVAFEALLTSPVAEEREAAAWAMGQVSLSTTGLRAQFQPLLSDGSLPVRRAALSAAGRFEDEAILRALVFALEEPTTAAAAFEAFTDLGEAGVRQVEAVLHDAPAAVVSRTATALSRSRARQGTDVLQGLLDHGDAQVRYRASRALVLRRRLAEWRPPGQDLLVRAIEAELAQGYRYHAALAALASELDQGDAESRFVAGEVLSRIQETERRLLALVAVVADPRIARLSHHLRDASPQVTARVLELIEQSLDTRLSTLVVPFLERQSPERKAQIGAERFDVPETFSRDVVTALVELGDEHLRRVAMLAFKARVAARFPNLKEEPMLQLVERLRFLRSVPVFKDLSPEDLMKLAEIASPVEHPAGKVIFRKGDPGDVLCVVVRGQVDIRDAGKVIATQRVNDFFGELALFDQEPRSADAVAVQDTELLEIGGADLESLMERRPEIAREIIRVLAKRLRKTTQDLIAKG